jgi:hypothetical protein
MRHLLLVLGLIVVASPPSARGGVVAVPPVRDNTLFQDADGDTSSGSGPALFAGNNSQNLSRRALLAFDVAAHVPAGARIDSVVLRLHVSNAPNAIRRQFTLHRVLKAWGEGGSYSMGGTGAHADPGDATWQHASYPDLRWDSPGGDFDPAASASLLVGDSGFEAWTGPGMTVDVRSWLAQPGANFGWLIQGEETGPGTARRFDSREADEPGSRPTLTVHYSETRALRQVTMGGLKVRYR